MFFEASKALAKSITATYNFLWPTAAAMWNLRWQVNGYLGARPDATVDELLSRFIAGSGIHGANLKAHCVDRSWEEQQEQLAAVLLTNLCAIYEDWTEVVGADVGLTKKERKSLQFPTDPARSAGVDVVLARVASASSKTLERCLYPAYCAQPKYSKAQLETLLACYRYFKECRNCLLHRGGKVDAVAAGAYTSFAAIASVAALGMKQVPSHTALVVGQPARLHLRGVVGLSDVILRIVTTLDAELSKSAGAEDVFVRRWKARHRFHRILPKAGRERAVESLTRRAGFPLPIDPKVLEGFLLARVLVSR